MEQDMGNTAEIAGLSRGINMENMEVKQTKWEELSISNDFMFGKVMQNPELCKELLQRILPDLKIDRIEYPELQKNINVDMDAHGVRLDVYVKDDREIVYDIEMQVSDTKELPKRSRYYQGMIDLQLVDAGQHYKKLNKSYIIFICPFDLYGEGRHIYTFENICKEDNNITMGDEAVKIFLNADGMMDDVSGELKAFLDYVAGQKPEDSYVKKLDKAIQEAKMNREWRHEYMTLLMRDQENMEKGEEMLAKLILFLNEDGRLSDVTRVLQDKEYRQELYVEYHII